MARTCPICNFNFDKYGTPGSDVHRCLNGKVTGSRRPTQLEADKIAKGEMSPADLLPKDKPALSQPAGRLAPRTPANVITGNNRQPQPTLADVMAAIEGLRTEFEKLRAALTSCDLKPERYI